MHRSSREHVQIRGAETSGKKFFWEVFLQTSIFTELHLLVGQLIYYSGEEN